MKKSIIKFVSQTIIFCMCLCFFSSSTSFAEETTAQGKHTIWVIGDSTVSAFNDNYYYPRYGYGTQLKEFFDSSKYEVKNLALSGRSSKSYVKDPEYTELLNGMSKDDYLIIGFGHNDEKLEEDRYTNPNGTYKDSNSFANSLYENYIKKADEKGCKVVLCTPIVRRTPDGVWQDSNLHVTKTSGNFEGGDYPEAIRNLGKDLNIPVVDMTSLTKELYDSLGKDGTLYFHAWTSNKPSSVDNTHTNIWGGKYNAYLVAKEIKSMNLGAISDAVLKDKIAEAPSKEKDLVENPEYQPRKYDPNLKQSALWEDYGIWKGTVFGSVGDKIEKDNFSLGKDTNGNMNISVKNNKGKISGTEDGIAMYYYKIPVNSTFSLTAKAEINAIAENDQVSFGLMARDDMYVDESIGDGLGDYVAAAPLKIGSENKWNCYARKSGALTQGKTISKTEIKKGTTVDLKIESNSDGYACTFGNEETITGGFDFALTSVDSKYVYVGMFAARNADITFKDIKLVVDGKEVKNEINNDNSNKTEEVKEGWVQKDNEWYYVNSDNTYKTGWFKDSDGNWYMLDKTTGKMITGWYKDSDGSWYYLNPISNGHKGAMVTGWLRDTDGNWYYLSPISNGYLGSMITGWFKDLSENWYYSYNNGSMAYNTYIDGYALNYSGEWVY